MVDIQVVILNHGASPSNFQLSVDDKFTIISSTGIHCASDIYRIEVNWNGDETLLFKPGEVVELDSAFIGMELLTAIKSGERRFIAPTLQNGEIDEYE